MILNDAIHAQLTRRNFLKVGGLSLASSLLHSQAPASNSTPGVKITHQINPITKHPSALVLVVLQGGASGFDSFDPRVGMVDANIKGPFKEVETSVKGVYFTELLEELGTHMKDELLVVRNLFHNDAAHDTATGRILTGSAEKKNTDFYADSLYPSPFIERAEEIFRSGQEKKVGYVVLHYSQGSLSSSGNENSPDTSPYSGVHSKYERTIYTPYQSGKFTSPFGDGFKENELDDKDPRISRKRYEERTELLRAFEKGVQIHGPNVKRFTNVREMADSLLTGKFSKAFELEQEPEVIREQYGCSNVIGSQFLLARRFIEAGAETVTVGFGDFDNHSKSYENGKRLFPPLSKGVSALLEDCKQRGLNVSVAIITEFSRTPMMNNNGGRDHWTNAIPAVFGGSRVKALGANGSVIGRVKNDGTIIGPALDATKLGETIFNFQGYERQIVRNGALSNEVEPFLPIVKR